MASKSISDYCRQWIAERDQDAMATHGDEYNAAAEWCAANGSNGECGRPLLSTLSATCLGLIDADRDAFARHVRATAYAKAMEGTPEE